MSPAATARLRSLMESAARLRTEIVAATGGMLPPAESLPPLAGRSKELEQLLSRARERAADHLASSGLLDD
jgi:hypothetical protein